MTDDEFAIYLGERIIADADKLRLFMPDCYSVIPVKIGEFAFNIIVTLSDEPSLE